MRQFFGSASRMFLRYERLFFEISSRALEFCSDSGEELIGGGKGVNWGGNEGVPKMVLARLYFLVIAMIKKDEKLSQKLSQLSLLS